ncbi:MAG: hypothetical protein BWY14_01309 [Parcubacteria group bacterium ADurb.Bin192]|nr:MAG: hypothetical protein BWY14_01309 [Parcubacteria group bacterium ADurb.Bin192]
MRSRYKKLIGLVDKLPSGNEYIGRMCGGSTGILFTT